MKTPEWFALLVRRYFQAPRTLKEHEWTRFFDIAYNDMGTLVHECVEDPTRLAIDCDDEPDFARVVEDVLADWSTLTDQQREHLAKRVRGSFSDYLARRFDKMDTTGPSA